MRHHTLIITAGLTLWAVPALSQTLVTPDTALAQNDLGGQFALTQTINGNGLVGADINATHVPVDNSDWFSKFWISPGSLATPIQLTYNYTTPQSLDGVAIWAATFVLPKTGHYTNDGTVTCFDLEIDHAQGTKTYRGLALDPTLNGAQQFGFDSNLSDVSQIRMIVKEDDRPLTGGDRNIYLAEFRGLAGNVARPISNAARCGAFVEISPPAALTNDDTPTLSGTAINVTNITVVISNDLGVPVQTLSPTLDANGNWTIDATSLPDGDYTASVTAVNGVIPVVGNTVSFSVDTLAPTLTLTTPADGTVTNDDTPTISGTAEVGATLTITITDSNGAPVETITPTIAGDGTWSIDASALPDGQYTIVAQALDAAGNSAMLAPVGITIDTLAPAVTLLTPADGALTNDTTPAIGGTTEAGATIVVTLLDNNGATIATLNPTVDAAGAWTIDTSALADGSYSVSATSTDAAGNSSSAGPNSFELDATAPALAINAPAAGLQTQDTTPTIGGVGEAGLTVTVEVRDMMGAVVFSATPTVAPDGSWSVDTSMLSDGAYTVGATSADAAGNSSVAGPVAFIIDTVAPALALITPADGALTNDDTPTISGTAEVGATLTVTLLDSAGMTVATLNPTVDAQGAWTIDASALPEGQYTVNATATDAAGNSAPVTSTFEVDLTPPPVAISSPTAGQILPTRQADVTGTSEAGSTINVELLDSNGMTISTQQATADANGDFSVSFQGLDNGTYTLNATSTDAAGNSASEQVQFSVDSIAPTLTITSPMDDSSTNQGMTTITGNTDADATVVIIIRDAQGAEIETINATPDANGDFSAPMTMTLAEGDYIIEVTSTRDNGLMTTVNVDLNVDTTAPILTIAQPAPDAVTSDTTPTIGGTTEPGLEVTISVKDAQGQEVFTGTATADAQGAWTIDASELGDGAYTVEATSSDDAGNTTTTDPNSFSIDATAPTVAITSPTAGGTIQDTTPTISGTAEPGATVEILVDGVKVGEATANAQGAWSFDVTDELTLGDHTIEATSSDDAGNMGSTGEVKITIEALPVDPVVITTPTEGGTVTGPDVIVSGTGEPGSTITVTINGESKDVPVGADGSWSVTFNDVPAGNTTITAKAGEMEVNVSVSVVDPTTDPDGYLISGGGCSSTPAAPTGSAWLLGLLGLIGLGRRKRR